MSTSPDDRISIQIAGQELAGWSDFESIQVLDACSGVSFTCPFDRNSSEARKLFRPFSFARASVSIGGAPLFEGYLADVVPGASAGSSTVGLSCYSLPQVLSENQMPASSFPLEFNELTLRQISERICQAFGLSVAHPGSSLADPTRHQRALQAYRRARAAQDAYASALSTGLPANIAVTQQAFEVAELEFRALVRADSVTSTRDDGAAFARVALEPEAIPWTFLADLAKQRGVVLTDTALGELAIVKSVQAGSPRARLRDGELPLEKVTASFSPQEYHSEITGLGGARPGREGSSYTKPNPKLRGVVRPSTFKPDDTEAGDTPTAVAARMGRMFGNLVSYDLEVVGWRDPSGALWERNTTLTLFAPSAMVYRETELLVREVKLSGKPDSRRATLTVVLPGAFSGEVPEVLPWED